MSWPYVETWVEEGRIATDSICDDRIMTGEELEASQPGIGALIRATMADLQWALDERAKALAAMPRWKRALYRWRYGDHAGRVAHLRKLGW